MSDVSDAAAKLLESDESPLEAVAPKEVVNTLGGVPVTTVSESVDYVKLLIYGDPGVGKTRLAGSSAAVPSMTPVLFIDIEGGTKTIRSLWPDIHVIRVRDEYDDKGEIKQTAWSKLQDVYEDLKLKNPYRTIVIDSLTEAHKQSMYSVMAKVVKKDGERDVDVPAQRDWGKGSEQVRRFVRYFRDLDCNVIFTALAQNHMDDSGTTKILPSVPGKLAGEIAAFMDEVYYLYSKAEKKGSETVVTRRILTQNIGKSVGKTRGDMPMTMESPTMSKIAELVIDRPSNGGSTNG